MILKSAVKRYLSRKLTSHNWIKKAKRKELWEIIDELKPRPDFDETMFKHQLACFILGVCYPAFCFWLDMGTGKTRLTLELLRYWHRAGYLRRAVIFITSDKAYPTWYKQIKRFKIGLPHQLLRGPSTDKWRTLEEFGDGLIFISYPGALRMVAQRVKGKKKDAKKKLTVLPALVDKLCERLDAFTMDESTRASGRDSLTHKMIKMMRDRVKIRYALAGRPFGRDPTLLYTQHLLVDGGKTLGDTVGMFRAAFFTAKQNPFTKNKHIKKFTFDKRNEDLLAEMIQHRSITYAAEECIDLPAVIKMKEEVAFSEEAQQYFDAAVQTIIENKGNMSAVKNLFLRMRQLSSGFVGFKNDETGEKAQVEFDDNPKFERQMELLEEVPGDRKAVVFYDFTFSGRKMYEAACDLGLEPIWIWSGTKDYERDLRNFERRDRTRVAILQNRVGAMSLDGLQVANYSFFYESPVGAIDREQAERRTRRQGQLYKIMQYDMIVKGSVDQKILDYHVEAEDLVRALLRNPGKIL